ncbi:type II CAAX prenyl endopeptidase Rce1 family protein [Sphingosinithalassobacter sp. CS137]|uniref:CPBP family glutamic-type intramembrane protease n=1 Tax=Sphingosinithalassobacter sp. CS137 TaxID=2762748 RepID=UPI00165E26AD|nr:CPBP family glutamic-type intramembrane protease [Sphingosinithalassobacter sp. CS137]
MDQETAGESRYLPLLPAFLFSARMPAAVYVLLAALLAIVGHMVLGAGVALLLPIQAGPEIAMPVGTAERLALFFTLVVFAPVVETLLMSVPLLVLTRFTAPGVAAVASAIGWGVVHSLQAPGWGLVIWWGFLIFSIAFLHWRSRSGYWTGIAVAAAIHALNNAMPSLALLVAS